MDDEQETSPSSGGVHNLVWEVCVFVGVKGPIIECLEGRDWEHELWSQKFRLSHLFVI